MKLSEAILLGSVGTEQAFLAFQSDGRTCAMGAALKAVGKLAKQDYANYFFMEAEWPWARTKRIECPECAGGPNDVAKIVIHLNDDHWWTRPRIAAWVATLESQEDSHHDLAQSLNSKDAHIEHHALLAEKAHQEETHAEICYGK